MTLVLRDYQARGRDDIRLEFGRKRRRVLYVLPTGGGKCLGRGTPVMMFDGTVLPVEDVVVGDLVMGPDSAPRRVESIARGQERLYRVTPTKGDPYVVNESHILSLKRTATKAHPRYPSQRGGEVVNVSVRDYLTKSRTWRHTHKGWRADVDFQHHDEPTRIPPYMLGVWLGDGSSRNFSITTGDSEIAEEVVAYAGQVGMRYRAEHNGPGSVVMHVVAPFGEAYGKRGGPTGSALRYYGLVGNKHVPRRFLTGSRAERLDLLAGLIDTDGYYTGKGFDLVFKSRRLADDTAFVARSLGFAAYVRECSKTCTNTGASGTYYRISITGNCDRVPCRVERKRAAPRRQKKDVLVTGISVEPVGHGDYFGFELSGPDRLFLLGDFTVTHNTVMYAAVAQGAAAKGKRVLILEHRKELIRQASVALARIGIRHRVVAPKAKLAGIRRAHVAATGWPMIDAEATVAVASVQTLGARPEWLAEFDPDLIVIDEAHHAVAGAWAKLIAACPRALLLGVTATPCRTNGQGLGDVFEVMVLGPDMAELIAEGWLVPFRIIVPPLKVDLSKVRMKGGDLDPDAMADELDRREITGDAIEHYSRLTPARPAIVFASTLKHADHVAEQFRAAGWRFEVIHGGLDDAERDRLIEGLASGALHGLVSKDLISEGTDIPAAEVAIFLRDTESEVFFLQAAGRVARTVYAEGFDLTTVSGRLAAIAASPKPFGTIIDHVGVVGRIVDGQFVSKHGRPHDPRAWSLQGKRKRRKTDEEVVDPPFQCPACYQIVDLAPRCSACDADLSALLLVERTRRAAMAPKQVDGQLVELDEAAETAAKIAARRAQAQAQTVEEMVATTGMAAGRAAHIIQARVEKERMRQQLRDLADRWYRANGQADVSLQRALHEAFGWTVADIREMKPKALRAAIDAVTAEVARLELGAPANDNGAVAIRRAGY